MASIIDPIISVLLFLATLVLAHKMLKASRGPLDDPKVLRRLFCQTIIWSVVMTGWLIYQFSKAFT